MNRFGPPKGSDGRYTHPREILNDINNDHMSERERTKTIFRRLGAPQEIIDAPSDFDDHDISDGELRSDQEEEIVMETIMRAENAEREKIQKSALIDFADMDIIRHVKQLQNFQADEGNDFSDEEDD